jgi:hypothetical protein
LPPHQTRDWFKAVPSWIRWLIALPAASIVGAIVVRRLEYAGVNDLSSGALYPAGIALTIFGAAHLGALAAPSHRKQVGLAIAFGELAVFLETYLAISIFGGPTSFFPASIKVVYAIAILIGVSAAVAPLVARRSLSDESRLTIHLPRADVGLRRGLGIAVALGASAAFEAIAIGTSYVSHAYSVATANMLSAVVGTAILVTLVVDLEPTKKTIAACIVGGVIFAALVVNITFVAYFFMRFHPTD